jgi:hypothetical protein
MTASECEAMHQMQSAPRHSGIKSNHHASCCFVYCQSMRSMRDIVETEKYLFVKILDQGAIAMICVLSAHATNALSYCSGGNVCIKKKQYLTQCNSVHTVVWPSFCCACNREWQYLSEVYAVI